MTRRLLPLGWPRAARADDEAGSVLLLTVAAVAVAIALTMLCAAATDVYLMHRRLYAVADAAAIAAAQSFALDAAILPELEGAWNETAVHASDDEPLAAVVRSSLDAAGDCCGAPIVIADAGIDDDGTVVVELVEMWRPSIASLAIPFELPLRVRVHARAVVR